jgi:hypothetical protein
MSKAGSRRAAAISAGLAGLGFGIPGVFGVKHFAETGEVWTFMGFPTYGDGPFTSIGIETSTPLLAGYVAVCAAETGLAVALWRGTPWARKASTALLPVEAAYWVGFALPFGPVLGLARVLFLRKGRG